MAGQPELGQGRWGSGQRAWGTANPGQLRQRASHRHSLASALAERQVGFKGAQRGLCTVCCSPESQRALSETEPERTDLPLAVLREKGGSFTNPNPFDLCSLCPHHFEFHYWQT